MKLLAEAEISHLRTESLNTPESPFVKTARVKHQRQSAHMRALIAMPPRAYPPGAFARMPGRFVVELTRIAPGDPLDAHDNLPGSFKAVVDGICDHLQVDDGDRTRVRFEYRQQKGPWGVRFKVSLEDLAPASTPAASSAQNSAGNSATEQAVSGVAK